MKKDFSSNQESKCGQCRPEIRLHILCSLILIYTKASYDSDIIERVNAEKFWGPVCFYLISVEYPLFKSVISCL